MNDLDAKLFSHLRETKGYGNIIQPIIKLPDNKIDGGVPEFLVDVSIEGYDMFDVSRSLVRLSKLGLISMYDQSTAGRGNARHLLLRPDIVSVLEKTRRSRNNQNLKLDYMDWAYKVNDYGIAFAKICLN